MAILKHIASKSSDYGRVMEYLMFEQDRLKNESLRDEEGNLVMRENYLIDSLECDVATFDIECRAGFKHHLTDKYLAYLKRDLMETCKREKLHQVDLLSPAKRKVTDREYWADTRGKINDSYLIPDREKAIRGRALGTNYTEDTLRATFLENSKSLEEANPEAGSLEKLDDIRHTDLPLVRNLQSSAITTVNRAYDRRIIRKNVDTMLRDPELYTDRRRHKTETLE